MRVKCTDKGRSTILEVGKEYEVFEEIGDKYLVSTKLVGAILYLKKYFEIIEEDKMENRIVRKWEDLIGMENGFGLTIDENLDVIRKGFHGCYLRKEELLTFESYLGSIKCMGFKFDYKPLRTVHEVIQEIKSLKSLTFKQGELNYFVSCCEDKYCVEAMRETFIIGVNYMTKEQAQKYADELNEIIGVGK